jgi:hypothetical protein
VKNVHIRAEPGGTETLCGREFEEIHLCDDAQLSDCETCLDELARKTGLQPRYFDGQHVWLPAFDNGNNVEPRQFAVCNPQTGDGEWDPESDMYSANVGFLQNGIAKHDDGERELMEDQIEGAAVYLSDLQCGHRVIGFGPAVHTLEKALEVVQHLDMCYELYDDMYGGGDFGEWAELCASQEIVTSESEFLAVRHFEGADVCVDLDGKTWMLSENDVWEEFP